MKVGILMLLAILPVCSTAQSASDWLALTEQLEQWRREGQVPALGLVIIDDGQPVLIRGFGAADPDTPFRWGSITKSFTALAALQLARTSVIELDTPLDSHAFYTNPWAEQHPVRLADLLELSAGLADLSGAEFNDNRALDLSAALQRGAASRRLLWPAGLQHSYSNVAPGLTAAWIEQVSGESFERYLTRQVFTPLGMSQASLQPVDELPGGFRADGETSIPYWNMTFRSFGALNASLHEMARFATVLLNQGQLSQGSRDHQVLPSALVERFFSPGATLGARAGLEVSYAAGSYGWIRNGHLFWGHGGDADGYLSRYGLLRSHGRGYLLVINTDNPPLFGRMRRLVESTLLENLDPHPPLARVPEPLEPYTGHYYPASVRFGRERWQRGDALPGQVTVLDGALEFRRGKRRTRLIPQGQGRFIRPGDPAVTVVFVQDEHGSLYLQGELGNFVNLSRGPCPGFLGHCE